MVVRCAGRHFRDMGAPIAILSDFAYPGLCFGAVCLLVTCAAAQLPLFKRLPWEKNLGCAVCCTALLNASVVSWPSLEALYTIWSTWSGMSHFSCDSRVNILNVQAPPGAILACGLTCGYFVQDSLLMVLYPKETTKELGGPTAYKIMWMHHIISIIVWPYAMLNGVGAVFVIQNLSTEITNVRAPFDRPRALAALARRAGGMHSRQHTYALDSGRVAGWPEHLPARPVGGLW